jgi:hypothetical protein
MRLADVVFRQGHLSESALIEAVMADNPPRHLDQCEICSARAVELNRWLADVRRLGIEAADEQFAPEQLIVQQDQILRRLDQIDEPPRVIAFPGLSHPEIPVVNTRRVAPAWLGVAAAAGLVLGLIGGQMIAGMTSTTTAPPIVADTSDTPGSGLDPMLQDIDSAPAALSDLDQLFPSLVMASTTVGG